MTGVILFLIVAAYVACILKKRQVDAMLGVKNKGIRWGRNPFWLSKDRTGLSLSLDSFGDD